MSRRRRKSRHEIIADEYRHERGASPTTKPRSRLLHAVAARRLLHDYVLSLDDRRFWHPDRYSSRPVKSPRKDQRNVVEHPRNVNKPLLGREHVSRFAFRVPEKVTVCVRRKQRKEVLFAKDLLRSGRGKSRRRNEWSDVSC